MEKEDERLKALQLEAESRLIMSSEAGTGCPWSQAGMGLIQVIPTHTSYLCQLRCTKLIKLKSIK